MTAFLLPCYCEDSHCSGGGGTPSSSVPHSVMHSPSSGLASPTYPSSGLRTTKHLLGHAADVTPQRMSSQGWEEEQIELRSACTPTDPAEQAPCPRPPWLTPRACFLICRWHRLLKSLLVLSPWDTASSGHPLLTLRALSPLPAVSSLGVLTANSSLDPHYPQPSTALPTSYTLFAPQATR